jgi:predicted nucleic acid-binding protein
MYTVDASVWERLDQREPWPSRQSPIPWYLRDHALPICARMMLVEVAGAISRTRHAPVQAQAFAIAESCRMCVRVLDEGCALHALTLAAQHGLRGADAVYAAVAHEAGRTLVTLDNAHLTRLVNLITVCIPAVALAALTPPPQSPPSCLCIGTEKPDNRCSGGRPGRTHALRGAVKVFLLLFKINSLGCAGVARCGV